MKYKPVSYVFKKCPEKHPAQESKYHAGSWIIQLYRTVIEHVYDQWKIHSPDNQRVGFGQHFQVVTLEQPCLALIINFFKMHAAKIRKASGEWAVARRELTVFSIS